MIYLFDFEDSFTYNLASELKGLGLDCIVIEFNNIKKFLENYRAQKRAVFLYGPGPGHPRDYEHLFPLIKKWIKHPLIFQFGVCLGHQLLWSVRGLGVRRCQMPVHGQSFSLLDYGGREQKVQIYHSLVIDLKQTDIIKSEFLDHQFLFNKGECWSSKANNWLTYQFHPESVGTSCPKAWFEPLCEFLYNENCGNSEVPPGRHLRYSNI